VTSAPPGRAFAALRYRARQFGLALLAPVAPAEVDAALAAAALPAPAAALFRAMPRPYQRHALNVAARLRREGHADPRLLRAALLHDIGKWDPASNRRVGTPYRVAATLLRRAGVGRALLARLVAGPPAPRSPRFPWYLQQAHAALGARLAAAAGVDAETVALIRAHERPAGLAPPLDALLRALRQADDQE
jgi:hypothetical protein